MNIPAFAEVRWEVPDDKREWAMEEIAKAVKACRLCKGMNIAGETESAPGYGNVRSPIVLVGQSLCRDCMAAQEPFTGGSAKLLEEAFGRANVVKSDLFIANVVHCHPPGDRKSLPHEIVNCSEYLYRELAVVRPQVVVTLGNDAAYAIGRWKDRQPDEWTEVTEGMPAAGPRTIVNLPHPAWMQYQPSARKEQFFETLSRAITVAFAAAAD